MRRLYVQNLQIFWGNEDMVPDTTHAIDIDKKIDWITKTIKVRNKFYVHLLIENDSYAKS